MIYQFENTKHAPLQCDHLNLGGTNCLGETISLNNKYLLRNHKPWIPISGEFHYSRVNRTHWKEELEKMKAGGITVVSAYTIWIYHEEIENVFDFNGNNDVNAFLNLCEEVGLEVILRIGPWAHGEVRWGGFPDWLIYKQIPLRDNNPQYLAYARRFYQAVYDQIKDHFWKDGRCIVGIQIENELTDNAPHLAELKRIAMEIGYDVPLWTATGWNSVYGADIPPKDFLPVFSGYSEAPWSGHTHALDPNPNYLFHSERNDTAVGADLIGDKPAGKGIAYELYPYATCELGGGMQVTSHRRPHVSGQEIYALSLCRLGSGNNFVGYYMYHGGTNKIGKHSTLQESKRTHFPNDLPVLSYDFQAPIGEYGILRPQYYMLRAMHRFILDFQELFAPMEPYFAPRIPEASDTDSLRYCMRKNENGGFIFINTYARLQNMAGHTDVQFRITDRCIPKNGMQIPANTSAILPFDLSLGTHILDYATAQLFHRTTDTANNGHTHWYFFAIPGIPCEYSIDGEVFTQAPGDERTFDDCTIHTFTQIGAELYGLSDATDAEISIAKELPVIDVMDISYHQTELTITPEDFERYTMEQKGYRQYQFDQIPDSDFVKISYTADKALLFHEHTLIADDFNYCNSWIIPTALLTKDSILILMDPTEDVYREV